MIQIPTFEIWSKQLKLCVILTFFCRTAFKKKNILPLNVKRTETLANFPPTPWP